MKHHAHVTIQWRGHPAQTLATVTTVSGAPAMLTALSIYDDTIRTLRDTIGCKPRDPANGPRHMRQILDSDTDGWVQVDLFACEATDCAPRGADVPPVVAGRA